jgi:hypothetical protein
MKLENLKKVYPAVWIEFEKEQSEMSLEWVEAYKDRVNILEYRLVFIFPEEEIREVFQTEEELFQAMVKIGEKLSNL